MVSKANISDVTTIKLEKETKNRLDKLKIHKRETYNDVLQKILSILNLCRADPSGAMMKLREIDKIRKSS
jgi:hypothetical protein